MLVSEMSMGVATGMGMSLAMGMGVATGMRVAAWLGMATGIGLMGSSEEWLLRWHPGTFRNSSKSHRLRSGQHDQYFTPSRNTGALLW